MGKKKLEKEKPKRKKLEKVQSSAQQQKGRLYIIVACIALLVCGCCCSKQQKRTCMYIQILPCTWTYNTYVLLLEHMKSTPSFISQDTV
jgi:hypothetical protein